MSRTRHTDKEKARIIREFEHHDGSAAAFCRQRGLSAQQYSPDQDFPSPGVDAPLNSNPQWSVPPLNFRPHTPPVGQHPAGRAQQPAPMNRPSAAQPPLVPNQGQRAAR